MSREILNAINVSLDGYSVLISLIIVISLLALKKIDSSAKWFALTNIAAIVYGISDLIMWVSEGTEVAWKLVVLPVSTFVFYASGILSSTRSTVCSPTTARVACASRLRRA